jgi:hypothetical protein
MVDMCLTLITSKPWFTSPSEMSSAGVDNGRYRIVAFVGSWDLGDKAKEAWEVIVLKVRADG